MKKQRKSYIALFISGIIVLIGIIVIFLLEESGKFIRLFATLSTVIGVFSVYIQIRKSKLVGQAAFTIEISKYLYELPELPDFIHRLGRSSDVMNVEYKVSEEERTILIRYLNYIKTIAALVKEKAVDIETLNKVFAYEFFIIINNKSVQEMELIPFSHCYHDIFYLYNEWTTYLNKHGFETLHDESALLLVDVYQDYIGGKR